VTVSVLDVSTQAQAIDLTEDLRKEFDLAASDLAGVLTSAAIIGSGAWERSQWVCDRDLWFMSSSKFRAVRVV
jgi:hypothetical protein